MIGRLIAVGTAMPRPNLNTGQLVLYAAAAVVPLVFVWTYIR